MIFFLGGGEYGPPVTPLDPRMVFNVLSITEEERVFFFLLHFYCLLEVTSLLILCDSYARYPGLVCSVCLDHFMIILSFCCLILVRCDWTSCISFIHFFNICSLSIVLQHWTN